MENCKNCNELIDGKYCTNCGHPVQIKRIDGHYIIHEVEHILHFERGILYTVKELLLRPGQNIRNFIAENRSRLVKPVIFIIITSLVYSLSTHFFHIEEELVNFEGSKESAMVPIFEWIKNHYGYANIIMGVFIALWTKLFFRKYDYNFFEILILLCFAMGMGMLIYSVFTIFLGITHINLMSIAGFVGVFYCSWAMGQFFDKRKVLSYTNSDYWCRIFQVRETSYGYHSACFC